MAYPLFSVITPCFNAEKYLSHCVESILKQKFSDWELFLIDDGSTDSTPKLCDDYAEKDNRIKVIHQKNAGVSAARNRGLDEAQGKWIVFIDSDDWFTDDAFSVFYKEVKDGASDRYIYNRYTYKDGKTLPLKHLKPDKLVRGKDDMKFFLIDMLFPYYDEMVNGVITGGIRGVNANLYRRTLIEKYHIRFDTNVKIAEDAMFNFDVMRNAESVTMTDVEVGYYRISGSSVMHRFTPEIDHINTQTIKGFKTRVGRLIDTDQEYGIAYMGLVAECLFRALKLKYLHSDYSVSYTTKKKEITEWLYSDIVQQGLKPEYTQWLPRGKKEMMECVLKHKMRRTFLVGRISILYLKLRKQI